MIQAYAIVIGFKCAVRCYDLNVKLRNNFTHSNTITGSGVQTISRIISDVLEQRNITSSQFDSPNPMTKSPITEGPLLQQPILDDIGKSFSPCQNRVNKILVNVINTRSVTDLFYVDGYGGSGRSFINNTFIQYALLRNMSVMATAWTGTAANILLPGKAVHNAFQSPFEVGERLVLNIDAGSQYGSYLQDVQIITIIDEISMLPKFAFETIDRSLRNICKSSSPLAGKITIVSIDFCHIFSMISHRQSYAPLWIREYFKASLSISFFAGMSTLFSISLSAKRLGHWLSSMYTGDMHHFDAQQYDYKDSKTPTCSIG